MENNLGLRKTIKDEYNQLEVDFAGYKVILRAYNEAAAYRFVSNFGDGEMLVFSETLKLPLPFHKNRGACSPGNGDIV
ncbi:MAG: glycoside hydrolase family 97 N-terminal domain-containing protein [Bacilli bacterium]